MEHFKSLCWEISVDIAKYGTASQESLSNDGEASRAIDGNTDGDFDRSVTYKSLGFRI